ncbi:class I SAM-dependent rRNA methyltransferase [Amphibacillus sp. Q70]|uniref:class I SAM-dependent rRNA methyltransferase n=1 Tax=Amphibacillus sp. Q70 TaxID=3453416 RepID=UPI003F85C756
MQKIKINHQYVKPYRAGYPRLIEDAIENIEVLTQLKEGKIFELVDQQGQFLGRGYYGQQNKGYGWVLTQNKAEQIDQAFFVNKLSQALTRRSTLFSDQTTTAFRVFHNEGDGIGGLAIDYYQGYFLITWYSEGIYQFKPQILAALKQLTSFKGIYQKKRFNTGGKYIEDDDFVTGERADFPLIIKENDVNFAVDLNDGPMTGIFLDQRHVRQAIRNRYAKGKTVLNTFSYTGAFSVAAALGGAKQTVSVDLANRSLTKTTEQFQINDLDETEHEIRVIDVFNYFNYAVKKGLRFDTVILDPPSFARSKKRIFSASKDYAGLLEQAISITADHGVIVASTNYSGFGINKFKKVIAQAFQAANAQYKIVEIFRLPEDFPTNPQYKEGNYLKVVFIKKIG